MSVWGTGRSELARGFSRQHRIIEFATIGYASVLRHCGADLPTPRPTTLLQVNHRLVRLPSCVTPSLTYYWFGSRDPPIGPEGPLGFWHLASLDSAWALFRGYGNINPLSIDYACRPRLRSRLTLGGLAWPRNPWSFGGGVSHSPFATHACILTRMPSTAGFPRRFFRHTTLPYPSTRLASHRKGDWRAIA